MTYHLPIMVGTIVADLCLLVQVITHKFEHSSLIQPSLQWDIISSTDSANQRHCVRVTRTDIKLVESVVDLLQINVNNYT